MGLLDRFKGSVHDRFAAEVLDALLRVDATVEAVYVPENFRIDYRKAGAAPTTKPAMIFLANTFAECEGATAQERSERINKLVSSAAFLTAPETWPEVRKLLRPVLRHAMFGRGVSQTKVPLRRPAMPYLAELVVVDQPTAMRCVVQQDLEDWGITADEAFAVARENLEQRAFRGDEADADEAPKQPIALRLADTDGDAYFSSLPLLPGWLASMDVTVGGQPVAVVSEPGGMFLVGIDASAPDNRIASLTKLALQEYGSAVRPISPVPYTVDASGAVVPYTVPRDDPAWAVLHDAETTLAAHVYGIQTEQMREEYEIELIDTYVGSLIRAKSNKDGSFFTVAAWTDGIESLLPYADYIALGDNDMFLLPFDIAISELGLSPDPDLYPPRYRVGSWPDQQVMDHLQSQAANP
jgi:hypothetical protein